MLLDPSELISVLQATYPFHLLEPTDVDEVFKHAAIYQYETGQSIYQQKQIANRIYILAHGNVTLTSKNAAGKIVSTEKVRTGTLFGMEGTDALRRWSTATADDAVIVISLNLRHIQSLLHQYPVLIEPLESFFQATRFAHKNRFPWKEVDETFYFADRRHPAVLFWSLITPIAVWMTGMMAVLLFLSSTSPGNILAWCLAGGLTFAVLIWGILLWIDWGNDYSIVTNRRVLFQERIILLYDSRQEAPINAVLSVGRDTSQIGRIFQFGELSVRTYTGVITLPAIRQPELVAEAISYLQRQPMMPIGRRERVEQMAVALKSQLIGETSVKELPVEKEHLQRKKLGQWLASLFMLRFEQGGNITYRTHWIILLRKTFFPFMVFLFLQLILLARLVGVIDSFHLISTVIVIGMLDLADMMWWAYQFMDWQNDYYVVTDDQVIDVYKKPLGTEDKRAAPLKNIQSINFKRNGFLGVLLNFGTVYILIGDNQLTFNNVFNPSEVQREIFHRLYAREYKTKLEEEKAEQLRIREWIEAYNKVLLDFEKEQPEQENEGDEMPQQETQVIQDEQNPENQGTIAPEKTQKNDV